MSGSRESQSQLGPSMDRRQMIKTVGAAGGVAAIGSGAAPHTVSPVGRSQAGPWNVITDTAGGLGPGVVAGVYTALFESGVDEGDISDDREDRIYETAETLVDGKGSWQDQVLHEYENTVDPEQTPYGHAAWTTIRTTTATYHANREDRSTAKSKARERLRLQTTRSIVNIMEGWNSTMKAMAPEMAGDLKNGWDQITFESNSLRGESDGATAAWTVELDGETITLGNVREPEDWNLPADPTDLEGRDEGLRSYHPVINPDASSIPVIDPMRDALSDGSDWATKFGSPSVREMQVSHSNLNTINVIDPRRLVNVIYKIYAGYGTISSDVGTFVDEYYDQASFGDWEPTKALTPHQLYSEFASSGETPRVVAELAASGLDVPQDAGTQAKVSHPDLPVDSAWGWLYPRLEDKSISIEPGTTIAAADYKIAYLIRVTGDTGETVTEELGGSSPLEILDVEMREENDEEFEREDTAGTDGEVVIWDTGKHGEEVHPAIEYPADHSDWSIVVYGAENQSSHSPSELNKGVNDGSTQYILPSTALNEGELVNSVRLMGPFGFEQPVRYTSDATTIDPGEIQDRYDRMTDFYDQVRDDLANDGVGVGGPDIGIPTIPGLGVIESAVVVILAIFGLGQLSN